MKVTFLGTGSGVPAKHRNVSSLALQLMNKKGTIWLFDCGEATQHQLLHTPLKTRKIEKIFITHMHGDHIFGLPGLLGSRSFQGAETPLTIYGPEGIKEFVEVSLKASYTHLRYPLIIQEFVEEGVLFKDDSYTVKVGNLVHGIPSYGFRIEETDSPGPLLMPKVQEAGIPSGPHLKDLKEGKKITLLDGRVFHGKDFIGPPKKGRVIAIIGDTRFTNASVTLAENANLLIHEATFGKDNQSLAYEYFHSTTMEAATIAKMANVQHLILNHISSRYQTEDIKALLDEATEIFSEVSIADDLATHTIPIEKEI